MGRSFLSCRSAVNGGDRPRVGEHSRVTVKNRSPATPMASSRLKMIHLNLIFVMVSSIREENAWIDVMHFCTDWKNFDS